MFNIAHVHPMVVHFPLALTPVAVAIQLYAILRGKPLFEKGCLQATAVWLMTLAALGAIAAAAFGDMAFDAALDAGVDKDIMEGHEELGMMTATILTILAIIEIVLYRLQVKIAAIRSAGVIAGVIVVLLLITTAYFGGNLVYEEGVNVAKLPEKHVPAEPAAPQPMETPAPQQMEAPATSQTEAPAAGQTEAPANGQTEAPAEKPTESPAAE
jgi:uncharacterized membrane protein